MVVNNFQMLFSTKMITAIVFTIALLCCSAANGNKLSRPSHFDKSLDRESQFNDEHYHKSSKQMKSESTTAPAKQTTEDDSWKPIILDSRENSDFPSFVEANTRSYHTHYYPQSTPTTTVSNYNYQLADESYNPDRESPMKAPVRNSWGYNSEAKEDFYRKNATKNVDVEDYRQMQDSYQPNRQQKIKSSERFRKQSKIINEDELMWMHYGPPTSPDYRNGIDKRQAAKTTTETNLWSTEPNGKEDVWLNGLQYFLNIPPERERKARKTVNNIHDIIDTNNKDEFKPIISNLNKRHSPMRRNFIKRRNSDDDKPVDKRLIQNNEPSTEDETWIDYYKPILGPDSNVYKEKHTDELPSWRTQPATNVEAVVRKYTEDKARDVKSDETTTELGNLKIQTKDDVESLIRKYQSIGTFAGNANVEDWKVQPVSDLESYKYQALKGDLKQDKISTEWKLHTDAEGKSNNAEPPVRIISIMKTDKGVDDYNRKSASENKYYETPGKVGSIEKSKNLDTTDESWLSYWIEPPTAEESYKSYKPIVVLDDVQNTTDYYKQLFESFGSHVDDKHGADNAKKNAHNDRSAKYLLDPSMLDQHHENNLEHRVSVKIANCSSGVDSKSVEATPSMRNSDDNNQQNSTVTELLARLTGVEIKDLVPKTLRNNVNMIRSLVVDCYGSFDGAPSISGSTINCFKRITGRMLDNAIQSDVVKLTDVVSLIKENHTETGRRVTSNGDEDEDGFFDLIEKVQTLFSTHSLKIQLINPMDDGSEVEEGRRRHYRRVFPIMVAAYMILSGVLIPLGFKFMALLGAKSLFVSKISLLMASMGGIRRMMGYDSEHTSQSQPQFPQYPPAFPSYYPPSYLDPWRRDEYRKASHYDEPEYSSFSDDE